MVCPLTLALFSGPIKLNEKNMIDPKSKRIDNQDNLNEFRIDNLISFVTNQQVSIW